MNRFSRRCLTAFLTVLCLGGAASIPQAAEPDRNLLAERVTKLSRGTQWKPVSAVPINFVTHHPQGMVKIGDTLFVSSVEIKVPTKRFPQPVDGYD
ncbi:MAG TPA: DUF6454 family protein, partial [Microvirga sp.]|nr:DUF6454 family protein [Microvirga sp.]